MSMLSELDLTYSGPLPSMKILAKAGSSPYVLFSQVRTSYIPEEANFPVTHIVVERSKHNSVLNINTNMYVDVVSIEQLNVPFLLSTYFKEEQIADIKERFKLLPRVEFDKFCDQLLTKTSAISVQDMTIRKESIDLALRSNLMELFNQVNKEMIITLNISAWDNEIKKTQAMYLAEAQAQYEQSGYADALSEEAFSLLNDDIKRSKLEQRFVLLDKLSDPALEIQRLVAFNLLLDQKKFETCKLICEFYETLPEDMKIALQTQV
jgi:hypothetical protein